jgi:hypothetical protein
MCWTVVRSEVGKVMLIGDMLQGQYLIRTDGSKHL